VTERSSVPPKSEIIAALQSRSETGWDAVSETVREQVRAASRPGRLLRITGTSSGVPGDLSVREQAMRALLTRALRADAEYETSRVGLDIDRRELTGVQIDLRGTIDAELRVVVHRVRRVVLAVVRDVLGEAQVDLLTHTVDVDLSRTVTTYPHRGGVR